MIHILIANGSFSRHGSACPLVKQGPLYKIFLSIIIQLLSSESGEVMQNV